MCLPEIFFKILSISKPLLLFAKIVTQLFISSIDENLIIWIGLLCNNFWVSVNFFNSNSSELLESKTAILNVSISLSLGHVTYFEIAKIASALFLSSKLCCDFEKKPVIINDIIRINFKVLKIFIYEINDFFYFLINF